MEVFAIGNEGEIYYMDESGEMHFSPELKLISTPNIDVAAKLAAEILVKSENILVKNPLKSLLENDIWD